MMYILSDKIGFHLEGTITVKIAVALKTVITPHFFIYMKIAFTMACSNTFAMKNAVVLSHCA